MMISHLLFRPNNAEIETTARTISNPGVLFFSGVGVSMTFCSVGVPPGMITVDDVTDDLTAIIANGEKELVFPSKYVFASSMDETFVSSFVQLQQDLLKLSLWISSAFFRRLKM